MITVGDVLEFLETLAPRYMKMDWDHVGLLCGRSGRDGRRTLFRMCARRRRIGGPSFW